MIPAKIELTFDEKVIKEEVKKQVNAAIINEL